MPETHHIHGPSTLKTKAVCAGWMNDQDSDKTLANEGEMLHSAVETGSLTGLDAEQAQCAQMCLDICAQLEVGAIEVLKEKRLSVLGGKTFGTTDRLIRRSRRFGEVLDWKFGRNDVDPASENVQGWAYTIGAFELWPEVTQIRTWFVLPRLDKVTNHTFSRADLPQMRQTVATIVDQANRFEVTGDASMLKRTEYGCMYCGRKAKCPLFVNYAVEIAKKYAPLEVVDEVHSSQITDPAQMSRLYTAARILEKMVDSVKTHALQMALEHGGLPGYEVAEKRGSRSIRDLGLAIPVLEKHLDDRELLTIAKISLGDAMDLIAEKQPRGQKSKIVAQVTQELIDNEAVTTGEPSRYLRRIKE